MIGQGAFGIAMKATYQSAAVFIKQIKSYSPYVSDIFRKEALVLSQIKHENIIRLLGVCDDPVSIMTEYCCFSLRPFQRNEQFNSLDQLLLFLHSQDLFSFFPTIGNSIVKDIVAAVSYLHENDIVHRDLKTGNVLVDNSHYNSTLDSVEKCRVIFNEKPLIFKLGDLGEGGSQATQTKTMVSNVTKTEVVQHLWHQKYLMTSICWKLQVLVSKLTSRNSRILRNKPVN